MKAKLRDLLEIFFWMLVLVFAVDNSNRYIVLESRELPIMLSIVIGARISMFVKEFRTERHSPSTLDWWAAMWLPFITLMAVMLLALLARFIWLARAELIP